MLPARFQSPREWHSASRHVLSLAVVVSVLAHAMIYFALPQYANEFSPVKTVRYDATLMPMRLAPTLIPAPASASIPTAKVKTKRNATPQNEAANTAASQQGNFQENAPTSSTDNAQDDTANAIPNLVTASSTDTGSENITESSAAPIDTTSNAKQSGDAAAVKASVATVPETARATVLEAKSTIKPETKTETKPETKRIAPAFAERISIEYKLTSAITDGVANFKWTRKGSTYEIESSTQATGFLVSAFAGVIYQESRGEITEDGLRPTSFSIRRGEGATETAEFQRAINSLSLKGAHGGRILPLNAQMQDMQSFLFQLGVEAPRLINASNDSDRLDVLVTNARKVYRYQFRRVGMETVATRMGKIETIRLISDADNPEDAYEVWLAPQYFYLPVKIKLYIGRFPVEQLATRIGISEQ